MVGDVPAAADADGAGRADAACVVRGSVMRCTARTMPLRVVASGTVTRCRSS